MADQPRPPPMSPEVIDRAESFMDDAFGRAEDWSLDQLNKLTYPTSTIPSQTLYYFGFCTTDGILPGGQMTTYSLMTEEEVGLQGQPYNTWATFPFNTRTDSLSDRVQGTIREIDFGSMPMPARMQPLRNRIWCDTIPFSGQRWTEKKLDDPANYQHFIALVNEIVQLFAFYNQEPVQERMRLSFNWIWNEYDVFSRAINARREAIGVMERVDLGGMLAEFYRALFTSVSNRTRKWIVDRTNEIQEKSKKQYETAVLAAAEDEKELLAAGKRFYETCQDLSLMLSPVDYTCYIPMGGFKGIDTSEEDVGDMRLEVRKELYYEIADSMDWEEAYRPFADHKNRDTGLKDRGKLMNFYETARDGRTLIREALQGDIMTPADEHWIAVLQKKMDYYTRRCGDPARQTWGFVCYRLTYNQTPEEWQAFTRKFEIDLEQAGKWVAGAESIKTSAGLQWLDGKELGIPENDLEAAKKHWASFGMSKDRMTLVWKIDCLAIDIESYFSYMKAKAGESSPTNDTGGYVKVIDPLPYVEHVKAEKSPGFKGNLKVLSTALFDDLYPQLVTLADRPMSFWPIARLAPNQVYTGLSTRLQEQEWEAQRTLRGDMMGAFLRHLRQNARAL